MDGKGQSGSIMRLSTAVTGAEAEKCNQVGKRADDLSLVWRH